MSQYTLATRRINDSDQRARYKAWPLCFITRECYDAVLFDMDGVITDTASLHAVSWKEMFDEYLRDRAAKSGQEFRPFDVDMDYRLYVDGKPRYRGVRDFLTSRDIFLPEGTPADSPTAETISGLGNRKNELLNRTLATNAVKPYPGSIAFIKCLREMEIKTAVVTSSQNCQVILRSAKIEGLFDASVDGNFLSKYRVMGKPAPDSYWKAAELLKTTPERAVVVEDAISGVQAGAKGGFGLVVGVARKGNVEELKANGADVVVLDLGEFVAPGWKQPVGRAA